MSLLNGLTILRYGHMYDTVGGMEQYLIDLNGSLLRRSNFSLIQVELTSDPGRPRESDEFVGPGRLRRISLYVAGESHEKAVTGSRFPLVGHLKEWVSRRIATSGSLFRAARPWIRRRPIPRRAGEPDDAGQTVRELHRRFPLDLICLHSAGGADASQILDVAEAEGIPVVYIHHFANERLESIAMRSQLDRIAGVAGVSSAQIPAYLRARFAVVSDGIDVEFFQRTQARPLGRRFSGPLFFLPARLTPTKGQADLIRAAGELKRRGLAFHVALAGRIDSPDFQRKLQELIRDEDVADRVEFVGALNATALRDWYGSSSVLVFPTRHHEGLPRILLEAQAMQVPPVVYDSGGSATGLKHDETGFLLPPGDLPGLIRRMEELLKSPDRRASMGAAGRRLVEAQFSLQALAQRHEQFYLRTLAEAKRARPPSAP